MWKYLAGLLLAVLMLPVARTHGQQRVPLKPRVVPKPFPVYSKYKKRPPVKVNPYLIDTLLRPIPMGRVLFHDKIDKEQQQADMLDGKADKYIATTDSNTSNAFTESLILDVDSLQILIENMPANGRDELTTNQQKIRYLRAVWDMLRSYNRDLTPDPEYYKMLESNMHSMLIAINENKLMEFAIDNTNIYTLNNGKPLFENHPDVRAYIYTQMGKLDPVMMIKKLDEYAADTFAGSIIAEAARIVPDVVFYYATSTNLPLKKAVYSTRDSLVQVIVSIAAQSKAPLKAFPFFSEVYNGHMTVVQIDSLADNPDKYYLQLVKLRLAANPLGEKVYTAELAYRSLKYVRQVDELHESTDDARFRSVDSMTAPALYYMLVYGQNEIYTSSFLGVFKRLMERMKPMNGNQLLDSMHYDHFRTFIRMCAGYNTLSTFLGSMSDTARTAIMSSFIGGLQSGNPDDLEDAVDVADAFGSIRDSALLVFLQKKVTENYELSYKEKSKKGMIVYSIMSRLFDGNRATDDTGAARASERLHLPPVNKVRFAGLANDSGIVYQQTFFFGDKDGQDSYENYMEEFRKDKNWKISLNKYWVVLTSTTGRKNVIYANLPLKEPEDEKAVDSLSQYLQEQGIHPTIMTHRGHSYHLPLTLGRLDTNVKIVVLGSCGGYHNLATVLERAPDAHIISSKQTGVMAVNSPIQRALNTTLLSGSDVNWMLMWRELEKQFTNKPDVLEKFADYVPPHKNLGAIFIKAYRKMMENGL